MQLEIKLFSIFSFQPVTTRRTAVKLAKPADEIDLTRKPAMQRDRCGRGEILLARFSEQDVEAGEFITPGSFLRSIVSAFPVKK